MARPADPWDADLPHLVSEGHVSVQALEDAIAVRELMFRLLPDVQTAALRVFRPGSEGDFKLIISGTVAREQLANRHFHSVAMRAKFARSSVLARRRNTDDDAAGDARKEFAIGRSHCIDCGKVTFNNFSLDPQWFWQLGDFIGGLDGLPACRFPNVDGFVNIGAW